MITTSKIFSPVLTLVVVGMAVWNLSLSPAQASTMTVASEQPNRYYELKAKIAYLEMFIEALRDGDRSPRPTFVTVLSGNTVFLFGTLARDPDPVLVEICGPTAKGRIDWGDGVTGNIMGLGCSGDVATFSMSHVYEETDSYKIRVEDMMDRDSTHVVAIKAN